MYVVFTSNGNVASFLNVRHPLGTEWHETGKLALGEHSIAYTIHTERGEPVTDTLTVEVESLWE